MQRSLHAFRNAFHLAMLPLFSLSVPVLHADYVWSPESLYNGTHPASANPWTTQWVASPTGGRSIEVTVQKGTGYYNYIVIPQNRLGTGTEFTIQLKCRIQTPTILPKTFYLFARNSVSNAYDIWQKWIGDAGTERTIEFPVQLRPIEGGTWTIYMGCQGPGSIVVDSLIVKEGRVLTTRLPETNIQPSSDLTAKTTVATGYQEVKIDVPAEGTMFSTEGKLIADGVGPVEEAVAEQNVLELQKLLNEAKKTSSPKTISLPKGTYRFSAKAAMRLDGISELTVDGNGSDIIFQRLYKGECFSITACSKVAFKNVNFDWNWDYKPIASIGKLLNLSEDKKTAEFEMVNLNPAQTQKTSESAWMGLFPIDPLTLHRNRKNEAKGFSILKPPTLTTNGNRITANFAEPIALETGGTYCIRHLYYDMIVFKMADCSHLTFDGINIYSMPGMGWLNTGETHHWQIVNCNIKRREGSKYPLTTAADGIHTNESKGDLVIRNCEFTGLGDDAINLHDNAWQGGLVYGDSPNQLKLLNCPKHRLRIKAGDVIKFFKPDYSPSGVELKVSEEPTYEGTPNAYVQTATTIINFATPVPAGLSPSSIAVNSRYGTNNVLIKDCRFVRLFGRAILFAGNNATIENNLFQNVYNTPIQLHTEIVDNHWGEGQGATNIVIRNNVFEESNFAGRWEGATIYAGATLPWGVTTVPIFSNILIEGNRFLNAAGPAMSFCSARDVVARNNTIVVENPAPNATPYAGTIFGRYASQLTLGGNTWINRLGTEQPAGVVYDASSVESIEVSANRLERK